MREIARPPFGHTFDPDELSRLYRQGAPDEHWPGSDYLKSMTRCAGCLPPNPRVQRTRPLRFARGLAADPPPVRRREARVSLGSAVSVAGRLLLVVCPMLLAATRLASQEPTPSPAPSPGASRTPEAKCKNFEPAVLVRKADPQYPAALRKKGVQGVVTLEGIVATDGRIEDIRVLNSPADEFSASAMEAARQYQYKPAQCNGRPVRVYVTLTMTFRLAK